MGGGRRRRLEWRASVIYNFFKRTKEELKAVKPGLKFGAYTGAWYPSYFEVGVNWASPDYDTSSKFSWATKKYMDYGYADLMDQMLIGAYASPARVYGTTEWTMQGFCLLAKERTMGACPMVAGKLGCRRQGAAGGGEPGHHRLGRRLHQCLRRLFPV